MKKLLLLGFLFSNSLLAINSGALLDGLQSDTSTITPGSVNLGTDTTGDYVSNILAGNGISTTGAASGETISHTISVNQDYDFAFTGNVAFTPAGTDDMAITTDADSLLTISGLADVSGDALCISGANVLGTCAAAVFTTSVSSPILLSPATGGADDVLIKPAGSTAFTILESGALQQNQNTTSQPTCDASGLGLEIMYKKGAGASEVVSKCICEQIAGPNYVWAPATATGDCT